MKDKQLYDWTNERGNRRKVASFYAISGASWGSYQQKILAVGRDKDVLEYGCGAGSSIPLLAGQDCRIIGIDQSGEAIREAFKQYSGNKLVSFQQMDAENLKFSDCSFDLVCGISILHHLDLERALGEIKRTLRPGCRAVFLEPLGHNLLINLFRKITPSLRVKDESPLRRRDLNLFKSHFHECEFTYFYLFAFLALPFRKFSFFPKILKILNIFDQIIFRFLPFCHLWAWQVVIVLRNPKKSHPLL